MKKNSEIIKAITELKSNQTKTLKLLLDIIERLAATFEYQADKDYEETTLDQDDYPGDYYVEAESLLEDLINNITDSSNILSIIALASSEGHECEEDMDLALIEKLGKIFEVFNELKKYSDDDLDEEESDECEDDDDEETLNSLLESLRTQLIAFEENAIVLVKLYNQNSSTQKLIVPNPLFSTSEDLNNNPLILQLINRGVEI